ncbi:MAG TPA: NAD-dependent epimerase/dehydratase family protein [Pyrinomonadaceae bacterium]|nr:NAD-dependent epimerase/dehydratase family protein [Pyrinomonadaceae bacterium]
MRCLVTGASGHLGSFLTERLVKEGAEVFALVRPESDLWRLADVVDRLTIIRAELDDLSSAEGQIASARAEAVFHLAWQGVTSASRHDPAQEDNLTAGLRLFDVVRAAGCRVWIGIGSQAEYGPSEEVLTEDTPVQPLTAYGASKLKLGQLTKQLSESSGIRYVWLRLLATYGPKDDERHLLPSAIRSLLAGEPPKLTAGEQRWDYLYVEDAANAIYQTAINKDAQGVFNLASGETHAIREIIEQVRDLIDPSLPLELGELPYPPDQQMRLAANIDRLITATGWRPEVGIEQGLKRTVNWYKHHSRTVQ